MDAKIPQMLLLTAVFAVMIHGGLSIKCHVCNTVDAEIDGKACPGDYAIEECNANQTYCRKIEQEINIDKKDTKRTVYQCAATVTGELNGKCLERTGTYRFKSWYCECDNESGCNSAGTATVSIVLSTVAVFVSLYRNL